MFGFCMLVAFAVRQTIVTDRLFKVQKRTAEAGMISPPVWQHRMRRVNAHRTVRSSVADGQQTPSCSHRRIETIHSDHAASVVHPSTRKHIAAPLHRLRFTLRCFCVAVIASVRELSACSEFVPRCRCIHRTVMTATVFAVQGLICVFAPTDSTHSSFLVFCLL